MVRHAQVCQVLVKSTGPAASTRSGEMGWAAEQDYIPKLVLDDSCWWISAVSCLQLYRIRSSVPDCPFLRCLHGHPSIHKPRVRASVQRFCRQTRNQAVRFEMHKCQASAECWVLGRGLSRACPPTSRALSSAGLRSARRCDAAGRLELDRAGKSGRRRRTRRRRGRRGGGVRPPPAWRRQTPRLQISGGRDWPGQIPASRLSWWQHYHSECGPCIEVHDYRLILIRLLYLADVQFLSNCSRDIPLLGKGSQVPR